MTIIGLVASGLGVSILPASFKRVQLNEMRWLPISEPDAVSEMWLVWAKHREQGLAAQRFRDYLPPPGELRQNEVKCAANHKAK